MITLMNEQALAIILLLVCVVPIAVLIVLAIVFRLNRSNNERKKNDSAVLTQGIDEEQKKLFTEAYGGVENINNVLIERNRVCVSVKDIDKVKSETLKDLGAVNVYIVGTDIKCSYGDRADYVYNLLK